MNTKSWIDGFYAGCIVSVVVLGIVAMIISNADYSGLKERGAEMISDTTDVTMLMEDATKAALFATDVGYVVYDGDRLYMETSRCGHPKLEK